MFSNKPFAKTNIAFCLIPEGAFCPVGKLYPGVEHGIYSAVRLFKTNDMSQHMVVLTLEYV